MGLSDILEICLITYNRATALENTLRSLSTSPFRECKITVFDNHSTDDTPQVIARQIGNWPHAAHIRHAKNIGPSANYLRALESASAPYVWVLCDDDELRFGDHKDLLDELQRGTAELLLVGGHLPAQSNDLFATHSGKTTPCRQLALEAPGLVPILSFLPASILKTGCIDSEIMFKGYLNVRNFYPHFAWIARAFEKNWKVYVARSRIVYRLGPPAEFASSLVFLVGWFNSCALIAEAEFRRTAERQIFDDSYWQFGKVLFKAIASHKLRQNTPALRYWCEIFFSASPAMKCVMCATLPWCFVPAASFHWLLQRFAPQRLQRVTRESDPLRV
jgi:hypothetical protein